MPNVVEITIRTRQDTAGLAAAEAEAKASGTRAGKGYSDGFASAGKNINGKWLSIALGGLAATPAVAAAGVGIGGLLVGAIGAVLTHGDLKKSFTSMLDGLQDDVKAATGPLVEPLKAAFTQFGGFAKSLVPAFQGIFTQVTPLIQPLLAGFEKLVQNVLPGLGNLLHGVGPAIAAISDVLSSMGTAVSNLLTAFTKNGGISASASILEALSKILVSISGPLGTVAGTVASVLAPAFGLLATALGKISPNVLSAIVGALIAAAAAAKVWAVAQGLLDVALDANPIGIVVVAIAAIAAGFAAAWQASSKFRDIIKDIGQVFLTVGILIVEENKAIVDAFLSMVGAVINGAAKAFGWVPGLGGLLKGAAKSFDGFKTGVDSAFDAMLAKMNDWKNGLSGAASTAHDVTTKINGDFNAQAKAATAAKGDLDAYTSAIKSNGVGSDQAKKARSQLITDMEKAGVDANTAKGDVAAYTSAVKDNGAKSQAAENAREKLVEDILQAGKNSVQGKNDLNAYTSAVKDNGVKSDAAKSARAKLIADLEAAGLDSKTAKGLVDALQKSISAMHGKDVGVGVNASASGTISITGSGWAAGQGNIRFHAARGAYVDQGTGSTADDVPAMLSRGELVVPAHMVQGGMVNHLRGKIPGFAGGGFVGTENMLGGISGSAGSFTGSDAKEAITTGVTEAVSAAKNAVAAMARKVAAAASAASASLHPTGSGGSVEALMKSMAASVGWTGAQWTALFNVEEREAGFSLTAQNPSSGAYGLAQFINGPSEYAQYGGNANTAAGQITGMLNYIKQRYGTPAAAWAHEVNFGWYDNGGWLKPGLTMAYNGTGAPERVGGGGGGAITLEVASGGASDFEQFMVMAIRNWVRVKGGGDVQRAFGR